MRKTVYIILVTLLAACASEPQTMPEGHGALRIACTPSDSFVVPAAMNAPAPIADITPEAGAFALRITGANDYDQSWTSLNAYASEGEHFLLRGDYTATVSYGDATKEGFNKPYYIGSESFTIQPRRLCEVEITAKPGNAKISVEATERFRIYFHDIALKLTTSSGGEFQFVFSSTATPAIPDSDEPLYVLPATTFTLTGTAFKQAATGTSKPTQVTLPTQQDIPTAAGKHYIYRFDAKNTGGAVLNIIIDDTVEQVDIDEELNDAAKPNE